MAVFEKENTNKITLDDTEPLTCTIENWHNTKGYTEFIIKVTRGPFSNQTWHIYKRYNDFVKLHAALQVSGIPLQLPPKKYYGNTEPKFIFERLLALQKYLNTILMNPILVSSLPARSFIDPANYCQPFSEQALQHVSLSLRGEVGWEVMNSLPDVGWRIRKHFYEVKSKTSDQVMWANWVDYGPDKYLEEKDIQVVFKSFSTLQHPHIKPIILAVCSDIGGLVIRHYYPNGSLRDLLCGSKAKESFMKKYGNPKGHKPLNIKQVSAYGRQILLALKFLQERGIPYGHLHTGNILIEDDQVKLLDIENGILGVPSFYRPYFMQHRKINTLEAIDVYSFGHTLYEMSFGAPLHESTIEELSEDCPQQLKTVLECILSPECCKTGLPSIDSLLKLEFFSAASYTGLLDKVVLKIPNSVKDKLKQNCTKLEERLKEEQKIMRSQKRLCRVQEMMSSEEERKKYKQKMKSQQQKQAKLEKMQNSSRVSEEAATDAPIPSTHHSLDEDAKETTNTVIPPPPPPVMTEPSVATLSINNQSNGRNNLLSEICNFNKQSLKRTKTK